MLKKGGSRRSKRTKKKRGEYLKDWKMKTTISVKTEFDQNRTKLCPNLDAYYKREKKTRKQ